MTLSTSSSTSSGFGITSEITDQDTIISEANTEVVTIEMGSPAEHPGDGTAIVVGGEAIAAGQDTLATGSISGTLDGNSASVAASFGAAAASSDGELAFTFADSFIIFDGDADVLVTWSATSSQTVQSPDMMTSSSSSTTVLFAADIGGSDVSVTTATDPVPESTASQDGTSGDCGCGQPHDPEPEPECDCGSGIPDANIALLVVDVLAIGDGSLIQVDASVIAVENALSDVTAIVVLAVE